MLQHRGQTRSTFLWYLFDIPGCSTLDHLNLLDTLLGVDTPWCRDSEQCISTLGVVDDRIIRPSQCFLFVCFFWKGKMRIYFRGTKAKFRGEQGTKTILGNREHKKTSFQLWRNRVTRQFISGEQGNRYTTSIYICRGLGCSIDDSEFTS